MLPQAVAHWGRFLAAATRRCLGRVAVPVWLAVLTDQRPVIGMVGRYPAIDLMGRAPRSPRPKAFLAEASVRGIVGCFQPVFPTKRKVRTCSSAVRHAAARRRCVRLACIRHAASVDPEPGSNSSSVVKQAPPSDVHHAAQFVTDFGHASHVSWSGAVTTWAIKNRGTLKRRHSTNRPVVASTSM